MVELVKFGFVYRSTVKRSRAVSLKVVMVQGRLDVRRNNLMSCSMNQYDLNKYNISNDLFNIFS